LVKRIMIFSPKNLLIIILKTNKALLNLENRLLDLKSRLFFLMVRYMLCLQLRLLYILRMVKL
jgi:hypothetical protein